MERIKARTNTGSGTPRSKTILARDSSARTFRPIVSIRDCWAHFSGTARPIVFLFVCFLRGGGKGNLLFYSVNVHQNKIQETLFNVKLIFRQGDREII